MTNVSLVPLRNYYLSLGHIWMDAVVVPSEAANVCQPCYSLIEMVSGPEPAGRLLDYE